MDKIVMIGGKGSAVVVAEQMYGTQLTILSSEADIVEGHRFMRQPFAVYMCYSSYFY